MSSKPKNQVCTWDFTVDAMAAPVEKIKSWCLTHCKKWAFQIECGETTDYFHYQGRVSLKVRCRRPEPSDDMPDAHWSVTSTANRENDFYVLKPDTKIMGPWCDTDPEPIPLPVQLAHIVGWLPWQQTVIDSVRTQANDHRSINVIVDDTGNNGKTSLSLMLQVQGLGRRLVYANDYRDIMRMVMDTDAVPLYIVDIPRAIKKDKLFQLFSAIESIRDGHVFDDRYKFREKIFNSPKVWVFMNTMPDIGYLSGDRWRFYKIEDNFLVNL